MTRVLLTGAGGFVGSHILTRILDGTDWDVVCLDSFRHNGITDNITDAASAGEQYERLTVIPHDLTAPISHVTAKKIGHVDWVVDAASRCSVDESIQEPAPFILNNVAVTVNTLEYQRRHNPEASLIHVSTDEVFGDAPIVQDYEHRPSSPYSASKAAQEDVCRAYHRTYRLPVALFTSANMFGERQSTLAFIPKILRAAHQGGTLTVHVPGGRYYTYVENTAALLVDVMSAQPVNPNEPLRRVVLPGQQWVTNRELVKEIVRISGRHVETVEVDPLTERAGYDDSYAPLPSYTGWTPPVTFGEGLERTVQWGMNNPEWMMP